MAIVRQYRLKAAPGKAQALQDGLKALAGALKPLPGFEGAELYSDVGEEGRFTFLERWASLEDHRKVAPDLPNEALALVRRCVDSPPEANWVQQVPID